MARMPRLPTFGARTDHIDGTSHPSYFMQFLNFELLNLPHPRFGKGVIDNHDHRQSCAFRSRAGKFVIILTTIVFCLILPLFARILRGANLFSQKLLHMSVF